MARRVTAAIAGAIAVGAGGCAGSGGEGAVTFQLFGDAAEIQVYRKLVQAYQHDSPDRVKLIAVGDRKDHLAKLSTSFAAGRPPDVFLINHRNLGAYATRGGLDPVGPRLDAAGGLERRQFFALPLEAFTIQGRLQCLPQNVSSLVVFYNRTAFERGGIALPRGPWTYRQFMDAARRLTREGRYGVVLDPSLIRAGAFVWSAGGDVVDDDVAPTRFTLGGAQARRGLDALVALRRTGVAPDRRAATARSPEERFLRGEAAMILSSRREVPTFRTIRGFRWDVAPFPVLERPASVLHADAFCMARGGDADAAWRFIEFAAGPQGQAILARGGRTVPSLRAVATSRAFLDPRHAPASSRVFLDQVGHLRRLPSTRGWPRAEELADTAVEQAFYGERPLADVLAGLARETAGRF